MTKARPGHRPPSRPRSFRLNRLNRYPRRPLAPRSPTCLSFTHHGVLDRMPRKPHFRISPIATILRQASRLGSSSPRRGTTQTQSNGIYQTTEAEALSNAMRLSPLLPRRISRRRILIKNGPSSGKRNYRSRVLDSIWVILVNWGMAIRRGISALGPAMKLP